MRVLLMPVSTARKQFIESSLKALKTLTFWIRDFFVFSIEGEFK